MNDDNIKAVDFNDAKALNKALKAAITAIIDMDTAMCEPSVNQLLSMLIKMGKENHERGNELRALQV